MSEVARVIFRKAELEDRRFGENSWKVQKGIFVISEDIRHEIIVTVPEGHQPYAVGSYLVGAESFRTDDYGRLVVSRKGIVLVPEKPATSQAGR